MPMDFEKYMDLCAEVTSQEFIKATINAVQLQDKNLSNWVTSFATDSDVLDFDPAHKAQNVTSRKENSVSLKPLTSYRPSYMIKASRESLN